jgi:hypothetical protein
MPCPLNLTTIIAPTASAWRVTFFSKVDLPILCHIVIVIVTW